MKKIAVLFLFIFQMLATSNADGYRQINRGDGEPLRWPDSTTPSFRFNLCQWPDGSQVNDPQFVPAFSAAVDSWAVKGSRFFLAGGGSLFSKTVETTCAFTPIEDGEVFVRFVDFQRLANTAWGPYMTSNIVAFAFTYRNETLAPYKGVIFLATKTKTGNPVNWVPRIPDPNPSNPYPGFEETPDRFPNGTTVPYSFKHYVIHEIGHILGLAHYDSNEGVPPAPLPIPGTPQEILSPMSIYGPAMSNLERIYADDYKAMISIYPSDLVRFPSSTPDWDLSVTHYFYGEGRGVVPTYAYFTERVQYIDPVLLKYAVDFKGPLNETRSADFSIYFSSDEYLDQSDHQVYYEPLSDWSGKTFTNSASFDVPPTIPFGTYNILEVIDMGGAKNVLLFPRRIQIVDTEAPIFDPGNFLTSGDISSGDFTLSWPEARDDRGSGLAKYILHWRWEEIGIYGDETILPPQYPPPSYRFRWLPAGHYTITLDAVDNSGNAATFPSSYMATVTGPGDLYNAPIAAGFLPNFSGSTFSLAELESESGIPIYGVAFGGQFQSYQLQWTRGWESESTCSACWGMVGTPSDTPANGLLGTLTKSTMGFRPSPSNPSPWGEFTIKLTVQGATLTAEKREKIFIGMKPGWPTTTAGRIPISNPNPLVVDLDGNGDQEVVVSTDRGVVAYYPDGTVYKEWVLPYTGHPGVPAAGDLDGDGVKEIVVATTQKLYALTLTGPHGILAGWPISLASDAEKTPVIADIDFDAAHTPEVIFSSGISLYAFHADGSPVVGWPVTFGSTTSLDAISSPAVADFTGDGPREVAVATKNGLYAFQANGNPVPGWNPVVGISYASGSVYPYLYSEVNCAPVIGDIDGDGELEIVAGVAQPDAMVYIVRTDGSIEESESLRVLAPDQTVFYFGSPSLMQGGVSLMAYRHLSGFFFYSFARYSISWNNSHHRYYARLLNWAGTPFSTSSGAKYGEDFSTIDTPLGPISYAPRTNSTFGGVTVLESGLRLLEVYSPVGLILDSPIASFGNAVWSNLDGDAKAELVFLGKSASQIPQWAVTEFPESVSSGESFWPMFRHDPARRGLGGHEPYPPTLSYSGETTVDEGQTFNLTFTVDDPNIGPEPVWLDNLTFSAVTLDGQPLSNFGASFVPQTAGTARPVTATFTWRPGYATLPDGTLPKDFIFQVTVSDGHNDITETIPLRVNDTKLITSSAPAAMDAYENSTVSLPIALNLAVSLAGSETVTLEFISVSGSPLNWPSDARWNKDNSGTLPANINNNLSDPRKLNTTDTSFSLLWTPDARIADPPIGDYELGIPTGLNPGVEGPFTVTFKATHSSGGTTTLTRDFNVIHVNEAPDLGGGTKWITLRTGVTTYAFKVEASDYDRNFWYVNHQNYCTVSCSQAGGTCSAPPIFSNPLGIPGEGVWTYQFVPQDPEALISGSIKVTVKDWDANSTKVKTTSYTIKVSEKEKPPPDKYWWLDPGPCTPGIDPGCPE